MIHCCCANRCRRFKPQFWQPPASTGRNPRCYLTLMCCGAMLVYVMPKQHWKKCWSKSGARATENQPWPPLKLRSWLYRRSTFQQIPSSPFTSPNCSPQWRTKLNRGARGKKRPGAYSLALRSLMLRPAALNRQIWCLLPRGHRWVKPNWHWISSTRFPLRAMACCFSVWRCRTRRSPSAWFPLQAGCRCLA